MSRESVRQHQAGFIEECNRNIAICRQQIDAFAADIQTRCRAVLPVDDLDTFLQLPQPETTDATAAKTHVYMGWYVSMLMKMRDDVQQVRESLLPSKSLVADCEKELQRLGGRLDEILSKITLNEQHLPDSNAYQEPSQQKKYQQRLQQWRQTGIRLTKQADKLQQELISLQSELTILKDPPSGFTQQQIDGIRDKLLWRLRQASNAIDITRAYLDDSGIGSIEQHMTNFGRLDPDLIPYLETTSAIANRYIAQLRQLLARENVEIDVHWSGSAAH